MPAAGTGDAIELRGLRVLGTHGVLEQERRTPQPFEVDLDLEVDTAAASRSDDLGDTVDYSAVLSTAAAVIAGPHRQLLESLASSIAERVDAVTVRLRKLRPPVPLDVASAGVRVRRARRS